MAKQQIEEISADEVYNPKDFVSLSLDIYFQNLTTNSIFNEDVQLIETGDKTMVLQLPAKSCAIKQSAMVEIYRQKKQARSNATLSFTGKITELEKMDDGKLRVTLKLVQYEDKEWESFLEIFSSRQDEINNFFESMKR